MQLLLLVPGGGATMSFVAESLASLGLEWESVGSCHEAKERLSSGTTGTVLVASMPAGSGPEEDWTSAWREFPLVPVLVCAPEDLAPPALVADLSGFFDWIRWPREASYFPYALRSALQAAGEPVAPVAAGPSITVASGQESLIGFCPKMKSVLHAIERASHTQSGLLIRGEAGSGKSLAARAVHHSSRRRDRLLITVDGSHPPAVLDRELFGPPDLPGLGRLERAGGGTLLLDHLDRIPLATQDGLLRWLQQPAPPVDAESSQPIRPRLLAACASPLEQAVSNRLFREDLLRWVGGTRLDLPALRERSEDIPYLAAYFLARFSAENGVRAKAMSPVLIRALGCYHWPENVRELASVLRRASSFGTEPTLQLGDLPSDFLTSIGPALLGTPALRESGPQNGAELADLSGLSRTLFEWARKDARFRLIPAMERELIIHALAETKGNQVQAARLLGITRATLRKRLNRFNIQRDVYIH